MGDPLEAHGVRLGLEVENLEDQVSREHFLELRPNSISSEELPKAFPFLLGVARPLSSPRLKFLDAIVLVDRRPNGRVEVVLDDPQEERCAEQRHHIRAL